MATNPPASLDAPQHGSEGTTAGLFVQGYTAAVCGACSIDL